jgi:hypothetical protein
MCRACECAGWILSIEWVSTMEIEGLYCSAKDTYLYIYRQLIIYIYEYWYDIHMLQGLQDESCLWNHWKLPRARLPWSLRWPKGRLKRSLMRRNLGTFWSTPRRDLVGHPLGPSKLSTPFLFAKFMLQIDIPSDYLYNIAMEHHHF